ncbi:MAG TPA: helix-turn-helix transcriptional regulator [Flavisolibacter sp.]|nr:helix-turn-helix transcriptional regulator [Flavisolibacter sp.]
MNAPNSNDVIGRNIRVLREQMGLTQETLAHYLNTSREQVAYYEAGTRNITTEQLSKLAGLFCLNEYDFYEEDPENRKVNLAFAFRADGIGQQDLESIGQFKKIVRNYLNMQKVALNG